MKDTNVMKDTEVIDVIQDIKAIKAIQNTWVIEEN